MIKRKNKKTGQIILTLFLAALAIVIVAPFVLLLAVSFSSEGDIVRNGYKFIPETFTLDAYRYVCSNPATILQAYKVTIIFSVTSMVLTTFFTSLLAYPLSRTDIPGKNVINFLIYFTTLFSGGLAPTYMLYTKYLHIDNTYLIYLLPNMVSVFHVFMLRTFFKSLPDGMIEAAMIDGAGQYRIFFTFALPLSKPALATVALFTFLGSWNSWFESMLYIKDQNLVSLQYFLQKILKNLQMINEATKNGSPMVQYGGEVPGETARMAMAVLVAGPALVVFPFFQKYFVKGMTIGSVKG